MRKCERRRGGAFAGDNTVGQRLIVVERCEAVMAEVEEGWRTSIPVSSAANLLLALAEGRIAQFVRSDFATVPTQAWDEQWSLVTATLARDIPPGQY